MKITKTDYELKINNGSSFKVYICKTHETAMMLHNILMTAGSNDKDSYWHVSTCAAEDVLIPDFFKGLGLYRTIIEHNNCDWDKEATYELYMVED